MAEIVGTVASAVTLAALVKLCIDAFDVIQIAKSQDVDLKKLNLRLNIEKCRLWTWGQAMGFTPHVATGSSNDQETGPTLRIPANAAKPLDNYPFSDLVEETLCLIISLFQSSETLTKKYGCQKVQNESGPLLLPNGSAPGPIELLSISFGDFKIRSMKKMKQTSLAQKGSWAIRDRKKFELLIHEAKSLIDGLQDITKDVASLAGQERIIRSRITTINDVETLDMVAEVCEKDHPRISDAASTKADAISLATTFRRDITEWADSVVEEESESDTETVNAIESWTTTEMKHKLFSLLQNRSERAALKQREEETPVLPPPTSKVAAKNIEASDVEANERILQELASAADDKEFLEELSAIKQWFHVLSEAERTYSVYELSQSLGEQQTNFFSAVFQHMADSIKEKPAKMSENEAKKHHQIGLVGPAKSSPRKIRLESQDNLESRIRNSFSSFVVEERQRISALLDDKRRKDAAQQWVEFASFSKDFKSGH